MNVQQILSYFDVVNQVDIKMGSGLLRNVKRCDACEKFVLQSTIFIFNTKLIFYYENNCFDRFKDLPYEALIEHVFKYKFSIL